MIYNERITIPNNTNNSFTLLVVTGNDAVSRLLVCGLRSVNEIMMAATNNIAKM
jgi:hypothetical protein